MLENTNSCKTERRITEDVPISLQKMPKDERNKTVQSPPSKGSEGIIYLPTHRVQITNKATKIFTQKCENRHIDIAKN